MFCSRTSAWLGLTDINLEGSLVPLSDPMNGIQYSPLWAPAAANDPSKDCIVINNMGEWDFAECKFGSSGSRAVLCMISSTGLSGKLKHIILDSHVYLY